MFKVKLLICICRVFFLYISLQIIRSERQFIKMTDTVTLKINEP